MLVRRSAIGLLRSVLFRSGVLYRMAKQSERSAILMFHGIPRRSSEEFHDLLRLLSKHFAFVPMAEIIERVSRNRFGKSAVLALSFDDGLRNHATVVYPVLSDLCLPATFYVCPGLIDRNSPTWTWELWCRIPWLPVAIRTELRTRSGRRDASDRTAILEWMKGMALEQRRQIEDLVRCETPAFAFSDEERELYEVMSWDQLANLGTGVINIGSHTMTHSDLPSLTADELGEEVGGSRELLEKRLGRPIHDFCYPDGRFNDIVAQAVAKEFRSAVTTVCGGVGAGDSPHQLRRIGATLESRWVIWLLATHTGVYHRC